MTDPPSEPEGSNRRASHAGSARLFHQIQVAARSVQKLATDELAGSGLTSPQLALLVVVRSTPTSQRTVASELGIGETAITAMVKRLEGRGLLERCQDPDDARVSQLKLTKRGAATVSDASNRFDRVNAHLDRTLGVEGVAQLSRLLNQLNDIGEIS